jgi:ElaB/YqjD/DUF883 family membrane-anchored ribosome-binding protein
MGERPDDVRRDPDPVVDPLDVPEETGSAVRPDPALGGGIGGGAVVDEVEVDVRPAPTYMGETTRGTSPGIVGVIRQNPVPAALTGIGLTWLFVNRRRGSSGQARYQERVYDYGYPTRYEDRTTSRSSAGEAMSRAQNRVGDAASRAQGKVGDAASQAQDRASEVASQAQDRVSNLTEQASYQARRLSGGFERMVRENPLAMGALAVGTGAAVGLAIPQSAQEHEVMGEARDTFVEKAQEKAQEAQEKVQRVAQEAQSAAKEEASNQGLTDQ